MIIKYTLAEREGTVEMSVSVAEQDPQQRDVVSKLLFNTVLELKKMENPSCPS